MTIRLDFLLLGTIAAFSLVLGTPGCARRAAEAPPAPAAAPPVVEPPAPEPAPAPEPVFTPPDVSPAPFEFDSFLLGESARQRLDEVARMMRDQAGLEVIIEGHCDERGASEYNMALGDRRARAARDYLVDAGVAAQRIQVVSFGEERPADDGHDEAAWARNRRAQFVVRQTTLSGGPEPDQSE